MPSRPSTTGPGGHRTPDHRHRPGGRRLSVRPRCGHPAGRPGRGRRGGLPAFLAHRSRALHRHGSWRLSDDQSRWESAGPEGWDEALAADPEPGAARQRQALQRPPARVHRRAEQRPLFVEMSFIDLQWPRARQGHHRRADAHGPADVSRPEQTFVKAERYWPELQKLKPGEIYVSMVIGAYVGSRA